MLKSGKNIKSFIYVIVSLCFLISFNSCSKKESEKLVFMTIGYKDQKDSQMVWDYFNSVLKKYIPGVEVEFIIVPASEFAEQFELKMISGTRVDVAWTGYAFSFAEQVEKGNYIQLDDLIKEYSPELVKKTAPWILNLGKIDGKIYQIPRFEWMNEWRMALATPKELFDKYWNMEEANKIFHNNKEQYRHFSEDMYKYIEKYLENIKANGQLQSGISFRGMNSNYGAFMYDSASAPIIRLPERGFAYDFTVYNYYELPEVKMFYEKMAEYYQKGYLPKNIMDIDNPRDYENTKTNKSYIAWFDEYINKENIDYISAIVEKNDKPYVKISIENDYYISRIEPVSGQVIPQTAKNKKDAIKFIELLNTSKGKELFNILAFGIKGTHYKIINENRIETLDYVGYPNQDSRYGLQKWSIGNVAENCYLTQSEMYDDYYEFMKQLPEKAIISPVIGFKPKVIDLKNLNMAVQSVVNEYESSLSMGVLGKDWEKQYSMFISKMKEAGIDKITDELQRQLDKYLYDNKIDKYNTIAE